MSGKPVLPKKKAYTLRLSEYFDCAQTIAKESKGKIRMPEIYRNAARDAVAVRETVSARFSSVSKSTTAKRSNAPHQYFDSWVKGILGILGHVTPTIADERQNETPANRYEPLDDEEPSLEFLIDQISLDTIVEAQPEVKMTYSMEMTTDRGQIHSAFLPVREPERYAQGDLAPVDDYRNYERDLVSISLATDAPLKWLRH